MEEWERAMIRSEEHLSAIKESIKDAASKSDIEALCYLIKAGNKEIINTRPKANGIKDRILLILTIVICSIAAGTSAVALAMKVVGG